VKITSYGLFWLANEIDWSPGRGTRNSFRLLARVGSNRGAIKVANFREQQGIYILYDDYGPYYVGLTRKQGLGKRLKDHLSDRHRGAWDRFSWFGFNPLGPTGDDGVYSLLELAAEVSETSHTTIGDLEALLIQAIGPKSNAASMRFQDAEKWTQIEYHECAKYLGRVGPSAET
jgi:hypothetical protein